MAGAGGQTLALDVNPGPDLGQSYLTAGRIQAQQNQNDMAPLDMAAKQLDLQQKQALAPLELKAAQQKLVEQGLTMRASQTKAQQDAADRTMERIGKAALTVLNASPEGRQGEWEGQLAGLLKTGTIDKPQYDALMKQQPTDDLLNHIKDGHQTYQEMLKADAANKTAAQKARLTPAQIAKESNAFKGTLKDDVTANKDDVAIAYEKALGAGKGVAEAAKAAMALSKTPEQVEQERHPGQHYNSGGFLGLGAGWIPDEQPAAAQPAGFLPPNPAAAPPVTAPAPAAAAPAPSSNLLPGADSMARVYAGSQPPTLQSLLGKTAAPPPAAAKTREMQPAKNDKLGGNSEEDVYAAARKIVSSEPAKRQGVIDKLKELGLDPGKL